jgi:hypothetical protein
MELELTPQQPSAVVEAVAALLVELPDSDPSGRDPWWQAGIDEAISERSR